MLTIKVSATFLGKHPEFYGTLISILQESEAQAMVYPTDDVSYR